MAAEQPVQGRHAEVAQVLVVDGVELAVGDQLAKVGHFDHRDAVLLDQRGDAVDETVGIGNVGEHVVSDDHVG